MPSTGTTTSTTTAPPALGTSSSASLREDWSIGWTLATGAVGKKAVQSPLTLIKDLGSRVNNLYPKGLALHDTRLTPSDMPHILDNQ